MPPAVHWVISVVMHLNIV